MHIIWFHVGFEFFYVYFVAVFKPVTFYTYDFIMSTVSRKEGYHPDILFYEVSCFQVVQSM